MLQGGSNMTGTDLCVNKCKQSRSYLNHLVLVHGAITLIPFSLKIFLQGGSNMTGTDLCINKCKQSRSYLNHLVLVYGAITLIPFSLKIFL